MCTPWPILHQFIIRFHHNNELKVFLRIHLAHSWFIDLSMATNIKKFLVLFYQPTLVVLNVLKSGLFLHFKVSMTRLALFNQSLIITNFNFRRFFFLQNNCIYLWILKYLILRSVNFLLIFGTKFTNQCVFGWKIVSI